MIGTLHAAHYPHAHSLQELGVASIVLLAVAFLLWRFLRREDVAGCSSSCHTSSQEVSKLLRPESLVREKRMAREDA